MVITKKAKNILLPTLLTSIYVIFIYFFMAYQVKKGLLISIHEISSFNVGTKFLCDFISSLLPVIVLLLIAIVQKKPLKEAGITLKSPILIAILFSVYLVMFFGNGDFTIRGIYESFFYLLIVAFPEEFIFRGYLFTAVDREAGFWAGAVISGILFGIPHAFMPSILNGDPPWEFILSMMSELLGQGILAGGIFALLYKKSKTLFVPVLIHAILDYSGVLFAG